MRPPTFVVFTNLGGLYFSHELHLVNQIWLRLGFRGAPIVLKTRPKAAAL